MLGKELRKELTGRLWACIKDNSPEYEPETIYYVNEYVVAKRGILEDIHNEYNVGICLFENGIQVPKMLGLIDPEDMLYNHAGFVSLNDWYLLRERVYGTEIELMQDKYKTEALRQLKTELLKVLDLGIIPTDSQYGLNSIFDYDTEKLFLIDYEYYRNGTSEDIDSFYKRLTNGPIVLSGLYAKKQFKE